MARNPSSFRLTPPPPTPSGGGLLGFFGGVVAVARWALLPLGLMALVAVGVHAAADTVDDRILLVIERVDAWLDGLLGAWSVTQSWVDAIGPAERLRIARILTLAWELTADVVLAFPVLAYRPAEADGGNTRSAWRRFLARPSPMHVLRPLATAAVCLAGACAVARMVQGAFFLSTQDDLGSGADPLARVMAVVVLVGVLASLGGRAVLGSFRHASDAVEEGGKTRGAVLAMGLWGSALTVPLAVAALMDASPVVAFFR